MKTRVKTVVNNIDHYLVIAAIYIENLLGIVMSLNV
jgi:hypothetical protein